MSSDTETTIKIIQRLLSSVPSREQIMRLAYKKLKSVIYGNTILSKNEEEILNAYVNNIVVSGNYIKVLTDEGKVITVNPLTYCMDRISGTNFDENKIKTFLDWINFYIFDPS